MRSLPTTLIKGLHGVLRSKGRQSQAEDAARCPKTKRINKVSASKPAEKTATTRRWRLFRMRRPTGQAKSCHGNASQPAQKRLPITLAEKENAELKVDLDNLAGKEIHGAPATMLHHEADLVPQNSQQQHRRSDSNSDVPSFVGNSGIAATGRQRQNKQPALIAPCDHAAPKQSPLSCEAAVEKLSPPLLKNAEPKPPLSSLEPALHRQSSSVETAVHKQPSQSLKHPVDKPPSIPSLKPAMHKPPLPSLNFAVHKQIPPPSETALHKPQPPPPFREDAVRKLSQLPLEADGDKPPPPSLEGAVYTPAFETSRHQLTVTPVLHNENALSARNDEIVSNERLPCAIKTIVHERRPGALVPKYKAQLSDDADVDAPLPRSDKAIVGKADKEGTSYLCNPEKHATGDEHAIDQFDGTTNKCIGNHNLSIDREPLRTRADLTANKVPSTTVSAQSGQNTKIKITFRDQEQPLGRFADRDKACINEQPVDVGVNARMRDTTMLKKGIRESKKPPQRTDETLVEEPPTGLRNHRVFEKPANRETNVTKPGTRDTGWKTREQETKEPIWVTEARMREAFIEQSSRIIAPQQPPLLPRQPRHPPSSRPLPRQPSRPAPVSPSQPISRSVLRPVNREAPYPDIATPTPQKKSTVSTPSPVSSTRRGRRASPDAPEPPPEVQALLAAAENGDLPTLASMLETVDVDSRDPYDGYSALTIASEEGRLEIVQYLVQHGANFHQRDAVGRTALFAAAVADKARVVAYLVDKGADPRIVDNEGRSVFWACCAVHASDAAVALLDAAKAKGVRVDIDARDPCGLSAIEFAAHRGHADILQLLRQRGAKEEFKKSGKGRLVIND